MWGMRGRLQTVRRALCSAAGSGEKGAAAELVDAITPDAPCGSEFYKLRAWHVATGDTVKRDDALCEIETAAFTFDYVWEGEESVLHEKLIRAGAEDVVAGSVLARLADPAAVAEDLPPVEELETMDAPLEKRALIVDMDASIAGAHALVLLAAQRETTRIPFVSASYGSVPVDVGVDTLRALLGSLSCGHVPVVRGAATPLSGRVHTPALRLFRRVVRLHRAAKPAHCMVSERRSVVRSSVQMWSSSSTASLCCRCSAAASCSGRPLPAGPSELSGRAELSGRTRCGRLPSFPAGTLAAGRAATGAGGGCRGAGVGFG